MTLIVAQKQVFVKRMFRQTRMWAALHSGAIPTEQNRITDRVNVDYTGWRWVANIDGTLDLAWPVSTSTSVSGTATGTALSIGIWTANAANATLLGYAPLAELNRFEIVNNDGLTLPQYIMRVRVSPGGGLMAGAFQNRSNEFHGAFADPFHSTSYICCLNASAITLYLALHTAEATQANELTDASVRGYVRTGLRHSTRRNSVFPNVTVPRMQLPNAVQFARFRRRAQFSHWSVQAHQSNWDPICRGAFDSAVDLPANSTLTVPAGGIYMTMPNIA